jgi:hypothetical protein
LQFGYFNTIFRNNQNSLFGFIYQPRQEKSYLPLKVIEGLSPHQLRKIPQQNTHALKNVTLYIWRPKPPVSVIVVTFCGG